MPKLNQIINTTIALALTLLFGNISLAQNQLNLGTLDLRLENNSTELNIQSSPNQSYTYYAIASNFSKEEKTIELYSSDAKLSGKEFTAKNKEDYSKDSYNWINLPEKKLVLKPGENKRIKLSVKIPENAGVGEHYSAIIAREKNSTSQKMLLINEIGLRVKFTITGQAKSLEKTDQTKIYETDRFIAAGGKVVNLGNTNLEGEFALKMLDIENNLIKTDIRSYFLKPGEQQELNLALEKPEKGIYNYSLENNLLGNSRVLNNQTGVIFGKTEKLAILIGLIISFLLGLVYIRDKLQKTYLKISNWITLKKASSLLAVLILIMIVNGSSNLKWLKTDLLQSSESGYLTTIKFGNLENVKTPKNYKQNWRGIIEFRNASLELEENLHLEESDLIKISDDQKSITFKNQTGPDNDGIIVKVRPIDPNKEVVLIYKNLIFKEIIPVPLESTVDNSVVFRHKLHSISFSSEKAEFTKTIDTNSDQTTIETNNSDQPITDSNSTEEINTETSDETISDDNSTEEINTETVDETNEETNSTSESETQTPENNSVTTTETTTQDNNSEQSAILESELKTLQEIIKDIPSSGEVLSEYILESTLVDDVTTTNSTTQVTTDPALLQALKNTPESIKDTPSTSEVNLVFTPNKKITFNPQSFSFSNDKTVSQNLGEMIFVQNRSNAWRTTISVSDLISTNGKGQISASNISVNPGQIKLISGEFDSSKIHAGIERSFINSLDQITLISVDDNAPQGTVFTISPTIKITIPAGTAPGLYRGQITIRSL